MNRLVAGIVAVIVVAVIVIGAVVFFIVRDDGPDDSDVGAAMESVEPIVRADAVVVPIRSADLGMPRSGMVSDVLVRENDAVEEGQLLVRLDDTDAALAVEKAEAALASAQADAHTLSLAIEKERELEDEARPGKLEQARLSLQRATERYLHLSGANRRAGAAVSVDGAALEAEYDQAVAGAQSRVKNAEEALLNAMGVSSAAGISETPDSRAFVSARDAKIAAARLNVADLQNALDDAQDYDKILKDAQDAVTVASALLQNAERDLEVTTAEVDEANRVVQEEYDDAEFQWRMIHKHYMGIELTDDELLMPPDALFNMWDVELNSIFSRRYVPLPEGKFEDNPNTRWNELKLFGMLHLHPFPSTHLVTCEGISVPPGMRCVEKDYDDAWDAFTAARESHISTEKDGITAIDASENAIVSAQKKLEDAERELEIVQSGLPETNAASVQSRLTAANAALDALLDFPDETEVAQAEAELNAARAALDALAPDAQEIAVAMQQMEDAEVQVAKLEAGRDPLDEERREARIAAAEARIESAQLALHSAQIALADVELRAPFAGIVAGLNVDAGEEVGASQVVMSLADTSEWELVTVDLDELSVVHLAEGDIVDVMIDALPELDMTGAISRISRQGETLKGSITYAAEVRISGSDPRLRWGMTASIHK